MALFTTLALRWFYETVVFPSTVFPSCDKRRNWVSKKGTTDGLLVAKQSLSAAILDVLQPNTTSLLSCGSKMTNSMNGG